MREREDRGRTGEREDGGEGRQGREKTGEKKDR